MDTVETIIGLDNISDYSKNFTEDKEAFYEVLSYVKKGTDIMTVFDTTDDKLAFFTSGRTEGGDKEFLLFVGNTAIDILRFFESKYTEAYLDFTLSEEYREKNAKSILLMSQSLVQLTGLKEEDLDNEDNN
jgi:hypothetical protein